MKLCSACLLGINCRYDGKSATSTKILELSNKETLIPVCPEQLGGRPTPRPCSEIRGNSGAGVLSGTAKVYEQNGADVSEDFILGAQETLKIAKSHNITYAIMKQKSPSCGCGKIYDGSFSGKIIKGDGVTTALLKENGIRVISEEDI